MREKEPEIDEMEILGKIVREELGIKPLELRKVKLKEKGERSLRKQSRIRKQNSY